MVDQKDKQDMAIEQVQRTKQSNWLAALEREKKEKLEREAAERRERAARLARLFEEEDVLVHDDEDLLDAGAAKQDVKNYIDKIETHLQVEKKILEAWQDNDTKVKGV